ncbi:MAG: hypothetical protein ASARMPRED_003297 [Alectoria sarmentosa]|nr:MAG: hypothetical protein ASARMPRED_003297 [Alectoria sarmentosa]
MPPSPLLTQKEYHCGEMDEFPHDAKIEIPALLETVEKLKARLAALETHAAALEKELSFYKGIVENCRQIFEKHRESGGEFKRERGKGIPISGTGPLNEHEPKMAEDDSSVGRRALASKLAGW